MITPVNDTRKHAPRPHGATSGTRACERWRIRWCYHDQQAGDHLAVGTRDPGQEVWIALTKADTGRGIVAGLRVAFIAIISDRLIRARAHRKKREPGLE